MHLCGKLLINRAALLLYFFYTGSMETSHPVEDNTLFGYKFVGDNSEKNIKPKFQRQESHQ